MGPDGPHTWVLGVGPMLGPLVTGEKPHPVVCAVPGLRSALEAPPRPWRRCGLRWCASLGKMHATNSQFFTALFTLILFLFPLPLYTVQTRAGSDAEDRAAAFCLREMNNRMRLFEIGSLDCIRGGEGPLRLLTEN